MSSSNLHSSPRAAPRAVRLLEAPQRLYDELYKEKQEEIERTKTSRNAEKLRRQQTGRGSLIEFVRWGPIGRIGLLRMLPKLYDGTHIEHPLASRRAVRHIEFGVKVPVDVLIDGEIATLECLSLDVIPAAVDIYI